MVFELKEKFIASVIINVISIICLICVSAHFTKISSVQEKIIVGQNENISVQMDKLAESSGKIDELRSKILSM